MCRVALFDEAGEDFIKTYMTTSGFLSWLEKDCGGHGNGLVLIKDNKIIFFKKGLKYSTDEIERKLRTTRYDWALFHTRIASFGEVSDDNCHPYVHGRKVLAMNGTESWFKGPAKMLNTTDTEAVMLTALAFNKDLISVCRDTCSSTFIGFDKKPFVVSKDSEYSGIKLSSKCKGTLFASNLPDKIPDIVRPKKYPFVWTPGTEFETEKAKNWSLKSYNNAWDNIGAPKYVTQKFKEQQEDVVKDNIIDDMESNVLEMEQICFRGWRDV